MDNYVFNVPITSHHHQHHHHHHHPYEPNLVLNDYDEHFLRDLDLIFPTQTLQTVAATDVDEATTTTTLRDTSQTVNDYYNFPDAVVYATEDHRQTQPIDFAAVNQVRNAQSFCLGTSFFFECPLCVGV